MSLITGYDHFSNFSKEVTAQKDFWIRHCLKNLPKVIKIIIENTNETKCKICGDEYSLNYHKKSSLFSHYKGRSIDTVEHYLDNFVSRPTDELVFSKGVVMP